MSGFNHYDASDTFAQQYPKAFIASKAFNNDFFTYTVSKNAALQTIGTLGFVTSDAARCPAGRVLHATGRKLYPNVNPINNTFPLTPVSGTSLLAGKKFLMAVYDPISQLNGFIDPSASIFAKYDQLLDNTFDLGPTANLRTYGAAQAATPLGGLAGKLTMTPDSGALIVGSGTTQGAGSSAGVNAGSAVVGQVTNCTNSTYNVNSSACTPTSKVIVTPVYITSAGGNQPTVQVTVVAAGYFVFTMSGLTVAGHNLNWMIIN
jgi:hypothetical protein